MRDISMVGGSMAESIDGWYSNASARGRGGHGHDWENDDPIDRGRDSWLDDLHTDRTSDTPPRPRADDDRAPVIDHRPVERRTPAGERKPSRRGDTRRRSGSSPGRQEFRDFGGEAHLAQIARSVLAGAPNMPTQVLVKQLREQFAWPALTPAVLRRSLKTVHMSQLAAVVRSLRQRSPQIKAQGITAHLRNRGWPTLTVYDVRDVLTPPKPVKPPAPQPRIVAPPPPPPPLSRLARAVRTLNAETPGRGVVALTTELRRRGWDTTTVDVARALKEMDPPVDARAAAARAAERAAAVAAALARRADSPPAPTRTPSCAGTTTDGSVDHALAPLAVQVIRKLRAPTGPDQLAARLRACGFVDLVSADAERIAASLPESPAFLKNVTLDPAALEVAVRAVRSVLPGIGAKKTQARLREWGWSSITTAQVQAVLGRLSASSPTTVRRQVRPRLVPAAPHVAPPNLMGPHRTLDIRERPNARTCHGCGRVISSLGFCGCS